MSPILPDRAAEWVGAGAMSSNSLLQEEANNEIPTASVKKYFFMALTILAFCDLLFHDGSSLRLFCHCKDAGIQPPLSIPTCLYFWPIVKISLPVRYINPSITYKYKRIKNPFFVKSFGVAFATPKVRNT